MKCISGNNAIYLCVNKYCEENNSYVCSDTKDLCKESHEACSLVSLSYIMKKVSNYGSSRKYEALRPLHDSAKSITAQINSIISSTNLSMDIDNMLNSGKNLTLEDKERIEKFIGEKKSDGFISDRYQNVEKELEQFGRLISQFQKTMKQQRNKEGVNLRQKLKNSEKGKMTFDGEKDNRRVDKTESLMKLSSMRSKKKQEQFDFQHSILQQKKQFVSPQPSRSHIEPPLPKQPRKSKLSVKLANFQKIPSSLKNHIPKAPLFSKITNDIKTINSFFSNKFQNSFLLYRASEHEFLVSKFHEKCDGRKNTLTLVYTEYDKVIGGFTPLPWRTGTGEWYEDQEGKSFLFNLTSGQKYPLVNKEKAIWCSRTYGPSFGRPDLEISDKALYNSNSCANFPSCYNNGNYKNSPGSTQLFCGTKNAHFRIREWEVYELTFS